MGAELVRSTEPVRPAAGTAWADGTYRPHLDGLRAIAVYLVVAFHAGTRLVSGGFIGVDVFFVLSGYLVTSLLLRDLEHRGSVDFRRFYARRFRRLLPAAAVTIVLSVLVFGVIASPAEVLAAIGGVRAAALYVANWFFIRQSNDYFAADVQTNPVLHFWSLSVEEQYYALWPVLLGGLHLVTRRTGRRQRSIVSGVVAVAMFASLAGAVWIARTDLNRAYYGTDTRAYQLLAGAMLALVPSLLNGIASRSARVQRALALGSWVALAVLALAATSLLDVGAITRGALATVATVALIISLEVPRGGLRRVLSLRPVVYLGRVSYGTYLWHWILILVIEATLDVGPVPTAAFAALVATGLASLSYQLLEMPVRESRWLDHRRSLVICVGLATSVLIGVVVGPALLRAADEPEGTHVAAAEVKGVTPIPAGLDWQAARDDTGGYPICRVEDRSGCTLVAGGDLRVMVIGDSNAKMYLSMFEALARKRKLTLQAVIEPGCFWMAGIQRTAAEYDRPCQKRQDDWYQTIVPELDPDIVFVVNRSIDDPSFPIPVQDADLGALDRGSDKFVKAYGTRARETVSLLRANGRKVVIVEPIPVSGRAADPLKCLSRARYLDDCRFVATPEPTPAEVIDRNIDKKDDQVWSLDLDGAVCPYLPICDPVVNGLIVRWDPAHITQRFGRSLLPMVESTLDGHLILPSS